MSSWQNVEKVIERAVAGLGLELVEVERAGAGLVRVTIDRAAGDPRGEFVVVEDCERVTRQLQHVLEVEGLDYARLEVSSPGLDRPLRQAGDWRRFAGEEVALTLKAPFRGRKRFQGRLLAPEGPGGDAEASREEQATWRLLLAAAPAAAGGTARRGGKRAPPAKAAADAAPAETASDPVLEFRLDEVRDARLVPVVDFKGRRSSPAVPAERVEGAAAATDGEAAQ